MPSNHLILCHPLLLLPSIFSSIRIFSDESVLCIRWSKYWSFSYSISPSSEYSGLISFRMGWLDLLAVQGTLKSFLQHHSSKASILQCSAFFIVHLSDPYITTGKTIALTIWTSVCKITSLLFICSYWNWQRKGMILPLFFTFTFWFTEICLYPSIVRTEMNKNNVSTLASFQIGSLSLKKWFASYLIITSKINIKFKITVTEISKKGEKIL